MKGELLNVVYDIEALPYGVTMTELTQYFTATGFIVYDSTKGDAPYCVDAEVEIVDTNGKSFKEIKNELDT